MASVLEYESCDILIVGNGIMGSSIAYYLSKLNNSLPKNKQQKIIWMEQFDKINHTKGSSHGDGRIMRVGYPSQFRANMAKKSYNLFRKLENECFTELMCDTKYLSLSLKGNKDLMDEYSNNKINNISQILLNTNNDIKKYYPQFKLNKNEIGLLQDGGAVLYADKIIDILHNLCKTKYKLSLKLNCKINKIFNKNIVEYHKCNLKHYLFVNNRIILCTGSYTNNILNESFLNKIPIYCKNEQVTYFKPKLSSSEYLYKCEKFPVFVGYFDKPNCHMGFYGIPMISSFGVKVDVHAGGEIINNIEERSLKLNINLLNECKKFIKDHIIGLDIDKNEDFNFVRCLYTFSSDEEWIIGEHNDNKNIFVVTAFCGEGFKFSQIIGQVVAEQILNVNNDSNNQIKKTLFDICSPSRFKQKKSKL